MRTISSGLMVTGNFCADRRGEPARGAVTGILPSMPTPSNGSKLPNVAGMALFADGGHACASKPYAASGAYINRMSDYCGKPVATRCRHKTGHGCLPVQPALLAFSGQACRKVHRQQPHEPDLCQLEPDGTRAQSHHPVRGRRVSGSVGVGRKPFETALPRTQPYCVTGVPAIAAMFSNPRGVIPGVTTWARLPMPIRIGPTSSPPPRIFRMLRAADAASAWPKITHVGDTLHPAFRQQAFAQFRIKRGIHVHLAFVTEIARFGIQQGNRLAQAFAGPFGLVAELGLRIKRRHSVSHRTGAHAGRHRWPIGQALPGWAGTGHGCPR